MSKKCSQYWKKLFSFGSEVANSNSKILFELTHNEKKKIDLEYKPILKMHYLLL